MSDQTIDGVPRALIEKAALACFEAGFGIPHAELRALLDSPATGGEIERLNGMLDAASELLRTKERVNRELRSELERIKAIINNNFNLVLDRLFDESAAQAQGESVAHGTNSDKYKAELYDEVWQKARSLGFSNVTDALASLEKRGEPVAWIKPDVAKTLVKHECCYAFGGQNPAGTLIPLYA